MTAHNMPGAEVDIDVALVRALLVEQHGDLADLPITPVAFGWDHAIFRLGEDYVVQMPRREMVVPAVRSMHRWLPELAPAVPLPIPVAVRMGAPGCGFPWPWSVCAWLPGATALDRPPADLGAAAVALGEFVAALHQPAPAHAPISDYRGGPLADRDAILRERVAQLGATIDAAAVLALWADRLAVPRWPRPPVWIHGDLHQGNVIVDDGAVSAVIDFVDLGAGDPAVDLIPAWTLLSADVRPLFRNAAGAVDDDTWARGEAWALYWAIAVLANSADNPVYAALARHTLDAVLHS